MPIVYSYLRFCHPHQAEDDSTRRQAEARTMTPLAYSYLRFSVPRQFEGDSIRRQTEAANDWCLRNGVELDSVTTFRALGQSAYTGEHRKNPDRNALALYLETCKPGPGRRIPAGSYLIIENLDRLTREHIQPALLLVLTLLQNGIRIVQLKPAEMVFDDRSDTLPVMMMIMELSRGHSESAMKSDRVKAKWTEKKKLARAEGTIMSSTIPFWLRVADGRFEVIESAAGLVKRIFLLALDGMGGRAIAALFNREGLLVPGGRKKWCYTFIAYLLRDRRVLGEHQTTHRVGSRWVADGEPILDYYPPIIDERLWRLARDTAEKRHTHRGARGKMENVFKGLLYDAVNGGKIYAVHRQYRSGGKVKRYHVLANNEGLQAREKIVSFPLEVFERAILEKLRGISPRDLQEPSESAEQLEHLSIQREKALDRMTKIQTKLVESEEEIDPLAEALRQLQEKEKDLAQRIAELRRKAEGDAAEKWCEGQNLMTYIADHPGSATADEARRKLRSVFYLTLDGIWLVLSALARKPRYRACMAQVFFIENEAPHTYVIYYRPRETGGNGGGTQAGYHVEEGKDAFSAFSLRDHALANKALSLLCASPGPSDDEWSVFSPTKGKAPE